jgi:hypothetical protein
MEKKRLSIPKKKNYDIAFELAYEIACNQLAEIADIEEQCRRSDVRCQTLDSRSRITIDYLGQSYIITLPEIEFSIEGSSESVPLRDRILILHYFLRATGTPLADRLISFKELPEGGGYFPSFDKRTVKPLVDHFAEGPALLVKAAEKLGAGRVDLGDVAVTIKAFPRVPVTIILWRGDEEFPAQGNVAFDATISDYLSTEDITMLCSVIVWKLIAQLKQPGG